MDIRITNTCNNNCLYCLEQSYRSKELFLDIKDIKLNILSSNDNNILNFYWWNSLLHPCIIEIVQFWKNKWFNNIWILTNTYWITTNILEELIISWLNNVWFYFNSFNVDKHNLLVNWWIKYNTLINNIYILARYNIYKKCIIHVNNLNIKELPKIIYVMNKKFLINNFEFINYFPFDRPYDNHELLAYDIHKNRVNLDFLFTTIIKLWVSVKFYKFSKDFFWNFSKFYNYDYWVLNQIWIEDIEMLNKEWNKKCYIEKRCNSCFLKDYHNFTFLNK